MRDKQILLANIPFILIGIIFFIVMWLNLVSSNILFPLILICLCSQQLYIGFKFYEKNTTLRKQHMLVGILIFVLTLLVILKTHHLM